MSHDNDDYLWDRSGTPDPEVQRLEALLAPLAYDADRTRQVPALPRPANRAFAFATAALLVALSAAAAWMLTRPPPPDPVEQALQAALDVAVTDGVPKCNSEPKNDDFRLEVGQWLETDTASRARVAVADLGFLDVEPGSQLRLLATGTDEHRLELKRGVLHAEVIAPPRLLVVETPAVTAVDLGCAYTLEVADDGGGSLEVTSGWVALEGEFRTSFVPAGARATTRLGFGPGTPYFVDAAPDLHDNLAWVDFNEGEKNLDAVLRAARDRDTLTLVHMLERVEEADRALVYDRIEALVPPISAESKQAVLRLEPEALERLLQEVAVTW